MTNDDLLRLVGRLVVELEGAGLRIRDLEAELETKHKSNVVKMQPKAAQPPEGAPAPVEDPAPPKEPSEADPVPGQ